MSRIVWLPVFFISYTLLLYSLATLSYDKSRNLSFPSNFEQLVQLSKNLSDFAKDHSIYVFVLYCLAFIWKQTFAIPGSFFLNLLGGALYGVKFGLPLACVLTSIGATNCYLLSNLFAKGYVKHYFADKLAFLDKKIEETKGSLLICLISLRLVPMTPNWLLNLMSPLLNIPIHLFFISVLIGLMPYNYVCVQSGTMLSTIHSTSDVLTVSVIMKLLLVSVVLISPSVIVRLYKKSVKIK